MRFTSEAGDRAFAAAIRTIEAASSVEVVVAVRADARRWLVQHAIVGIVAALAVLVYAAAFEWDVWAILAFPLISGVLAALLVEYVDPVYRLLMPSHLRDHHTLEAARALFVARNLHATTRRTGVLVFLAVRTHTCEIVGDVVVVERVGQTTLDGFAEKLAAEIPNGAEATAKLLASFAPAFASALPHAAGQANELPDAPISA